MKLKDIESGMFASRKNLREVQNWIELLPANEKTAAYTVLFMTTNTLAAQIKNGEFDDVQYTGEGE